MIIVYFRCYSQVGRVGGAQRVSIGRGCEYHGVVVHEIGNWQYYLDRS